MGQSFYNVLVIGMVTGAFFGYKWAVVLGLAIVGSIALYDRYLAA
jgi:hypothetical protein